MQDVYEAHVLTELEPGYRLAPDAVVEDPPAAIRTGGTGRNHQREQMLAARMAGHGTRRRAPTRKLPVAHRRIARLDRLREPGIEALGGLVAARTAGEEFAQVVITHAAADDQHVLVAQWRERAPERQMG